MNLLLLLATLAGAEDALHIQQKLTLEPLVEPAVEAAVEAGPALTLRVPDAADGLVVNKAFGISVYFKNPGEAVLDVPMDQVRLRLERDITDEEAMRMRMPIPPEYLAAEWSMSTAQVGANGGLAAVFATVSMKRPGRYRLIAVWERPDGGRHPMSEPVLLEVGKP